MMMFTGGYNIRRKNLHLFLLFITIAVLLNGWMDGQGGGGNSVGQWPHFDSDHPPLIPASRIMMQHSTLCVCTTNIKWATFLFLLLLLFRVVWYSLTSLWWSHQKIEAKRRQQTRKVIRFLCHTTKKGIKCFNILMHRIIYLFLIFTIFSSRVYFLKIKNWRGYKFFFLIFYKKKGKKSKFYFVGVCVCVWGMEGWAGGLMRRSTVKWRWLQYLTH